MKKAAKARSAARRSAAHDDDQFIIRSDAKKGWQLPCFPWAQRVAPAAVVSVEPAPGSVGDASAAAATTVKRITIPPSLVVGQAYATSQRCFLSGTFAGLPSLRRALRNRSVPKSPCADAHNGGDDGVVEDVTDEVRLFVCVRVMCGEPQRLLVESPSLLVHAIIFLWLSAFVRQVFTDMTCDVDLTAPVPVQSTTSSSPSPPARWHASFYARTKDLEEFMSIPAMVEAQRNMCASAFPLDPAAVAALLRKACLLYATVPVPSRLSDTWCTQMQPRRFADYVKHIQNSQGVADFQKWLKEWKDALAPASNGGGGGRGRGWDSDSDCDDTDEQYALSGDESGLCAAYFVSGPVGSGKSSLVPALARDHGFEVIEVSSIQRRSGAVLSRLLKEATQSQSVQMHQSHHDGGPFASKKARRATRRVRPPKSRPGGNGNPTLKQNLVFVDEVDVVFDEDVGFYAALRSLAASTRCPIVFACNRLPDELVSLEARHLYLPRLLPTQVVAWLQASALCHGATVSGRTARRLVAQRGCDIRACMTQLQAWIGLSPYVSFCFVALPPAELLVGCVVGCLLPSHLLSSFCFSGTGWTTMRMLQRWPRHRTRQKPTPPPSRRRRPRVTHLPLRPRSLLLNWWTPPAPKVECSALPASSLFSRTQSLSQRSARRSARRKK